MIPLLINVKVSGKGLGKQLKRWRQTHAWKGSDETPLGACSAAGTHFMLAAENLEDSWEGRNWVEN